MMSQYRINNLAIDNQQRYMAHIRTEMLNNCAILHRAGVRLKPKDQLRRAPTLDPDFFMSA